MTDCDRLSLIAINISNMKKSTKTTLLISGFVIIIGFLISWNSIFPPAPSVPIVINPNDLPGIQTTKAPWAPEIPHLFTRLKDIGFPMSAQGGVVFHTHQHVDVVINGKPIVVPANIGIDQRARFMAPTHTHNSNGLIHLESRVQREYTLGNLFDVWGVRFTKLCIGGYCANATSTLSVYSNGKLVTDNPRSLVLKQHQEIMVVYGNASSTPKIISSYAFPVGD